MSTNLVLIRGNLTKDPELRSTTTGTQICQAGLAVNEKTGQQERTSFFDVVAFGHTAGALGTLKKGRPVLIEGRLRQETWEDKQTGQKRSKVVIVAWTVSSVVFAPKGDTDGRPIEEPAGQYQDDARY